MYGKIQAVTSFALLMFLSLIAVAHAWPTDNKIEKNVRPNQSVKLFKMYLYQPDKGCTYLPPPQTTSEGEKLGKVTTNIGKEKITKDKSACGVEFEASYVEWIYAAASQSGTDKFKLHYHNGANFIPINVIVNIAGNSIQEQKTEKNTDNLAQNNKNININNQIVNNDKLPSNPIFEKMKTGSVFYFNNTDLITNNTKQFHFKITDKTSSEFSTSAGTVFNTRFERIKSGNWIHNGRSCDGILYPMAIGANDKFNHNSVFINNNVKNSRFFNCISRIVGKKSINVAGVNYDGWVIENVHISKWDNGDTAIYNWTGVFSEEIGFWTEVNISERVSSRLTMNLIWNLTKYEFPSPEYQIKTTICSGSCDSVSETQKASIVDGKKFKNKFECEQNLDGFNKQAAMPVPIPTSINYSCVEVQ